MKKKASVLAQTSQLTVTTARGRRIKQIAPPLEMPTDLVPGEFLMIPDVQGKSQWYVYCDKQRFWSNGHWHLTGTIVPFDPTTMTEKEIYQLRRSLLKLNGWIR